MSKRFYLCKVFGDGSIDNPYRPAVADHGVSWAGQIATDDTGKPIYDWALCVVEAKAHAKLIADPAIDALPDYAMDAKVSAMHTPTKTAMKAALAKRGIETDWVNNADGFREVIRNLGKLHDARFDENDFDVVD